MLSINNAKLFRSRVKKPDCWDKYINPINNLLYAILLQAALDAGGYYQDGYHNGDDAVKFLEQYGEQYFNYLLVKERKNNV